MRTDTPGATIFYRVSNMYQNLGNPTHDNNGNGTNDTATYSGPLSVAAEQVRYFRAVAYKAGMTDSAMNEVMVDNTTIGGDGAPTALSRTVTYAYTPDKLNRSSVTDNGVTTAYSHNSLNQYRGRGRANLHLRR